VNSNLPYFFRKRKGQTLIQTWHGTPLKKMGFDLLERDFSNRSRKSLLRDSGYWDYLLVSSPFTEKVLIQAFKYKKVVVRSGLPRNDILFDPGNVREKIRESYGLKPHDRFVLYAPTWRDHASQGPSIQAFKELLESLPESDLVLGVRAHGWSSIAVDSKEYVGVLDLSLHPNISELYLAADILLTDFSSAMFDFSITGKPMAFLMPDLETYERTRGTYFGLERMGVGPVFKSGKNLAQKISRTDFDQFELARRRFVSKYAAFENGSATEQVVELIKMHLSS
jgi:CDP-glycerol glycerophosphotransferase